MPRIVVLLVFLSLLVSGCVTATPAPAPVLPAAGETEPSLFDRTEVPAAGAASPESAPALVEAGAECRNPYYPVRDGAWAMYMLADGSRVSHTLTVGANHTFSVTVQNDASTLIVLGQCTPEGIILLDVSRLTPHLDVSTLTVSHGSGLTLSNTVQVGDVWTQGMALASGDVTGALETTYTAAGFESLTLMPGTFQTLKVEWNSLLNLGGQSVAMHGYTWYAPDVGIVRSAMDGGISSELFAYNFP